MAKSTLTNKAYPEGDDDGGFNEDGFWTPRDIDNLRHFVAESDGPSPSLGEAIGVVRRYDETHTSNDGGNVNYNF